MTKLLPCIFIAIIVFTSCKKNSVEVAVPPPIVNYSITDSMHLAATTRYNFPDLYNNYNNKTYSRETKKVKSNFKVEGADIILIFEDTSVSNLGSELSLKIPNRNTLNISGYYSSQMNDIFYKWQQRTSSSSSIISVGFTKADTCSIQITYNHKTKTLSGTITKLKYPFGIYVPYYFVGSAVTPRLSDEVFLTSGGSFRQHSIAFQDIRSL